jgi:RNA methyltransferase, TrmH family
MMPNCEFITSPANPLMKEIRKAITRGGLTGAGLCVAETLNLVDEALRSRCRIRSVIAGESARGDLESRMPRLASARLAMVPDKLLDASSQGIVALVEPPAWDLETMLRPGTQHLVLVIDGVQDPGNMGTILRSAEAFAATGVLLLKGTVNPFNPKAVRASAGSIFRVPFLHTLDDSQVLAAVRDSGAQLFAAVPNGSQPAACVDLTGPCAIAIGSEGHGLRASLRSAAKDLSIPTTGVESLNAAISTAILLYEARRQRSRQHLTRPA